MAKKTKTTLKDVSDFLQQKPSTLVQVKKPQITKKDLLSEEVPGTEEDLLELIHSFIQNNGADRYELVLNLVENILGQEQVENNSVDEIMLLNTIAYLRLKG